MYYCPAIMQRLPPGVSPIEDLLNLCNSFRMFATSFLRFAYRVIAKPFFFRRDPEDVHDAVTELGARGEGVLRLYVGPRRFCLRSKIGSWNRRLRGSHSRILLG